MRIMAIDYGDARTGVAFSDLSGTLAGEAFTIAEKNRGALLRRLTELCRSRGAQKIVVGNPKNMNGSAGARSELCKELAADLEAMSGCPAALWDERRTTVDALRILRASGRHGRKSKERVDAVAASLILEGYLASLL